MSKSLEIMESERDAIIRLQKAIKDRDIERITNCNCSIIPNNLSNAFVDNYDLFDLMEISDYYFIASFPNVETKYIATIRQYQDYLCLHFSNKYHLCLDKKYECFCPGLEPKMLDILYMQKYRALIIEFDPRTRLINKNDLFAYILSRTIIKNLNYTEQYKLLLILISLSAKMRISKAEIHKLFKQKIKIAHICYKMCIDARKNIKLELVPLLF